MATITQVGNKHYVKLDVPVQLKRKIAKLLNELMISYGVKGNNKGMDDAFKNIFKSNLYVLLDNYYHTQKEKEDGM